MLGKQAEKAQNNFLLNWWASVCERECVCVCVWVGEWVCSSRKVVPCNRWATQLSFKVAIRAASMGDCHWPNGACPSGRSIGHTMETVQTGHRCHAPSSLTQLRHSSNRNNAHQKKQLADHLTPKRTFHGAIKCKASEIIRSGVRARWQYEEGRRLVRKREKVTEGARVEEKGRVRET